MNFGLKLYYLSLISYPQDCFHATTLNFTDIHTPGECSAAASAKWIYWEIQVLKHLNNFLKTSWGTTDPKLQQSPYVWMLSYKSMLIASIEPIWVLNSE